MVGTVCSVGLDPIWWTSSERRIRCQPCRTRSRGGLGAASLTTSRRAPSGWCSTRARPSAAAARDLGLTESSLRNWVEQARADRTKGKTGLTTAEREELARLRKENRVLQEERDILKNRSRTLEAPDVWTRNASGVRWFTRGRGRLLSGVVLNPLKNMVRGRPAHMSVVTPSGDPV